VRPHHCGSLFLAVVCLWGSAGGKQRGFKALDVLDTSGCESIQSAGGLRPYPSADPSTFPCELFDVMKPAAAWGLCSLDTSQINTPQGGSVFGCCTARIGLQAASC